MYFEHQNIRFLTSTRMAEYPLKKPGEYIRVR